MATLKLGSKGTEVRQLQNNLNSLGYGLGTADGVFGANTKKAVIAFQTLYGITADGIVGSGTQTAITTTLNRKNKGVLSKGQISSEIRSLQTNLKSLGFLSSSPDGKFGTGTEAAVISFQKMYSLTADGLVGNTTKSKIAAVISEESKPATKPDSSSGKYTPITNGKVMNVPKPGETITISLGTDKPNQTAIVYKKNAWSIEYSIAGCRKNYPDKTCTARLNSALDKYSSNQTATDLLKFNIAGLGSCFAGAMVEGFAAIGDIVEVTLGNNSKFNFMILDTKSTTHTSAELSANSSGQNPQCQNEWGHGYIVNGNQVQLSICEFIVAVSNGGGSAIKYVSGSFLDGSYVSTARIVGHAEI